MWSWADRPAGDHGFTKCGRATASAMRDDERERTAVELRAFPAPTRASRAVETSSQVPSAAHFRRWLWTPSTARNARAGPSMESLRGT